MILASAVTIWVTAKTFADNIFKERNQDKDSVSLEHSNSQKVQIVNVWQKIYRQFQAIENLSCSINTALGSQVMWYLAEGIMFYSIQLNTIIATRDMFKRIYNLFFFFGTFLILYVSADICNKVKSWLGFSLLFHCISNFNTGNPTK